MINIRELHHNYKEYADKEVTIGGWLKSKRDSKTFGFLVVNDGTFLSHCRWCTVINWKILQRFLS